MVKLFYVNLTKVDHTAALDELLHACIHKYTHLLIPFTHARSELFDVTAKNVFYRCGKKSACNAQQTCRLCCQVQCMPFISSKQSAVLHVGRDPELNKWMV